MTTHKAGAQRKPLMHLNIGGQICKTSRPGITGEADFCGVAVSESDRPQNNEEVTGRGDRWYS